MWVLYIARHWSGAARNHVWAASKNRGICLEEPVNQTQVAAEVAAGISIWHPLSSRFVQSESFDERKPTCAPREVVSSRYWEPEIWKKAVDGEQLTNGTGVCGRGRETMGGLMEPRYGLIMQLGTLEVGRAWQTHRGPEMLVATDDKDRENDHRFVFTERRYTLRWPSWSCFLLFPRLDREEVDERA